MELGPGGNELPDSAAPEDEERRALDKRKYLALSRRCKEIEQVCVGNVSGFRADVTPQLHKHADESPAVKPWTNAPCRPPHLLSMQMRLYFRWIRRFLVDCIKSKELPVVWRRRDGAVFFCFCFTSSELPPVWCRVWTFCSSSRFLMKTLDAHGDDYRNAQLTILLEASLEDSANVKPVSCCYSDRSCVFYVPQNHLSRWAAKK